MAGRKPKLTPEIEERILQSIKAGNFRKTAALWAGVGYTTLLTWLRKGRARPRSQYGHFGRRLMEAEKAAEMRAVALVMKAANQDPRAAMWWLERKFPEHWGRKDRHEVTGKRGGPIQHQDTTEELPLEALADPRLRELLDAAAERVASLAREAGPPAAPRPPKTKH